MYGKSIPARLQYNYSAENIMNVKINCLRLAAVYDAGQKKGMDINDDRFSKIWK